MKYYILISLCLSLFIKREVTTDVTETVLLDGLFVGFVTPQTETASIKQTEETPFELTLITKEITTSTTDESTQTLTTTDELTQTLTTTDELTQTLTTTDESTQTLTTTDESTQTLTTTTDESTQTLTTTDESTQTLTTTDESTQTTEGIITLKLTTNTETVTITNEVSIQTEIVEQNFCESVGLGDSISDGTQNKSVTCSLTVLGSIPNFDNMVSTIILHPKNNQEFNLGESFNVTLISTNIEFGFFDDPVTKYYKSPQTLNKNGKIQGHTHVTIQKIENPFLPPSVQSPTFFKGLNDPSDTGILTTFVDGELFDSDGTGEYRICTMTSSRSHAAVLMPVARRGSQDDCIRINIVL